MRPNLAQVGRQTPATPPGKQSHIPLVDSRQFGSDIDKDDGTSPNHAVGGWRKTDARKSMCKGAPSTTAAAATAANLASRLARRTAVGSGSPRAHKPVPPPPSKRSAG
uniref:Uncharacterized protein n=1 Tax=Plectus sambesii TaxID=2011161 RepID=A0A914UMT3_9BILA